MRPDTQHGFDFEDSFAERNGLDKVPGSGNQWHSKLDLHGFSIRVSCKSTQMKSYPVNVGDIDEAREACYGPGGTGEIPVWAIRIHDDDHVMVMVEESTWRRMTQENMVMSKQDVASARRERASVPALLREDVI